MSLLTLNQPVELMPGWWKFTWSATPGASTYWVYYRGALLTTVTTNEVVVREEVSGGFPQIEVADSGGDRPLQYDHPGRVRLAAWSPAPAAGDVSYLRFDEYIDSTWVPVGYSFENGARYHLWESEFLADGSAHTYRIVPVFTDGTEGTASQHAVLVVRHPSPMKLAATVSGGTTPLATIDEA